MTYFDNKGTTAGTCEQCGEEFESLYHHWALSSTCDNPDAIPYNSFALFSGGHDSLVSTHYCMENGLTNCVAHLDTNTGIDANEDFVREVCDEYGWPLVVYQARMTLEEFAAEWGFPKASSHSWAYRYFKERPLQRLARDATADSSDEIYFYTGVRKDESQRRMENISADEEGETEHNHPWQWKSPIADWTKEDCVDYMDEHDLPENPVVDDIHRSGECYCGAYAYRDEELIDLQVEYEDQYEWLMDVEKQIQEQHGTDEDYLWWGSSGCSSDRLEELVESEGRENVPVMCKDCARGVEDIETHSVDQDD